MAFDAMNWLTHVGTLMVVSAVTVKEGRYLYNGEATMQDYVLSTGPLAAHVSARRWNTYVSGVMMAQACSGWEDYEAWHAVQITGVDLGNGMAVCRDRLAKPGKSAASALQRGKAGKGAKRQGKHARHDGAGPHPVISGPLPPIALCVLTQTQRSTPTKALAGLTHVPSGPDSIVRFIHSCQSSDSCAHKPGGCIRSGAVASQNSAGG
jgi:hypothetical protein